MGNSRKGILVHNLFSKGNMLAVGDSFWAKGLMVPCKLGPLSVKSSWKWELPKSRSKESQIVHHAHHVHHPFCTQKFFRHIFPRLHHALSTSRDTWPGLGLSRWPHSASASWRSLGANLKHWSAGAKSVAVPR